MIDVSVSAAWIFPPFPSNIAQRAFHSFKMQPLSNVLTPSYKWQIYSCPVASPADLPALCRAMAYGPSRDSLTNLYSAARLPALPILAHAASELVFKLVLLRVVHTRSWQSSRELHSTNQLTNSAAQYERRRAGGFAATCRTQATDFPTLSQVIAYGTSLSSCTRLYSAARLWDFPIWPANSSSRWCSFECSIIDTGRVTSRYATTFSSQTLQRNAHQDVADFRRRLSRESKASGGEFVRVH